MEYKMRSNRMRTHLPPAAVIVLLCVPWIDGCGSPDEDKATFQRTISKMREMADGLEATGIEEYRSYTAPAYRRAIPLLEKGDASELPIMLSATFFQGYYSVNPEITGPSYGFSWLALNDDVRGFYLRSDGKPDLEIYPAFSKEPFPGTAWMVAGGAVVANEEEKKKLTDAAINEYDEFPVTDRAIIVDDEFLTQKKVLVGLILANGQKTPPVPAYFRPGPAG